jgi:hypothetical protein
MKFKTKPGDDAKATHKDFEGDKITLRLLGDPCVFEAKPALKNRDTVRVAISYKKLRKLAKNILKEIGE